MSGTTSWALGRAVELSLSDPWELAESRAVDRFSGTIIGVHALDAGAEAEAIAVLLDDPLVWQNRSYSIVVISARHGQGLLEALSSDSDIECIYIGVVEDEALDGEAITRRLEAWRGGPTGRVGVRLGS